MSNKLEQTSDNNAEVTNIAKTQNSPGTSLPKHIVQCIDMVKSPDVDSKNEIDLRCFYLSDNRVFFGVVFFETTDSFLVGASARMVMEQTKEIVCEPILPLAVSRVFKSNISMISKALDKYKKLYFEYLKTKGKELLPDYVKGKVLEEVLDFIQNYKEPKVQAEQVEQAERGEANSVKDDFERKGIHGVSDNAFTPNITSEKIH